MLAQCYCRPVGKVSFGVEKLAENLEVLMNAIVKAKPAAAKGQYLKSCVVAATEPFNFSVNFATYSFFWFNIFSLGKSIHLHMKLVKTAGVTVVIQMGN